MNELSRQLTEQFYDWEIRGRGTILCSQPCQLEPPFHPFFYHHVSTPYIDDGRRPTLVSSLLDFVKGKKPPAIQVPIYKEPDILPFVFEDGELHAYTIILPKNFRTPSEQTLQLLLMLANCCMPLSFEIRATHTVISIHLVCRTEDCMLVRSQCRAYFPDVTLHDDSGYLDTAIPKTTMPAIVDFVLNEEFTRPLNTKAFDLDPYISFFGSIAQLEPGETVLLQIQFTHTVNPWANSILAAVSTNRGDCFFMDAPEMLPLAKEKVSMPLFAVAVKLVVQAPSRQRIFDLTHRCSSSITMASRSTSNELCVRDDEDYTFEERLDDVLLRQSHRLGMLLNVRELATLVHFPSNAIHSEKLQRSVSRTKAAPASVRGHQYVLGTNVHQNKEVSVSLSESQRMRHMHIIGATGTGKSTLLVHLINQDIAAGNGFALLDPHGDLIDTVLTLIPPARKHDVVLIDPFDAEYPVACNILQATTDIEKELISSDLVSLFRRFSTSWGDQMNSVFANAILAFVESTKGGTLLDLRKFLIEKSFRDSFLQTVQDEQIVYYWQKEFPLLKSSSIGPILTKLDAFLRPKVIRNMVSQKESLPIADFMDSNKIVLIKLSQGLIGAENSYLLGALLVSKIHQAAMARQLQSKDTRVPFYLYIDEFQHFITPSMSDMLSGVRKYQLGLVLVHQGMEQVVKYDSELAHALLANAGTRICFRQGSADAKKMEEGLSFFKADDLQNLAVGEAIVRVNRAEDDFSLQIKQQSHAENQLALRDEIIGYSRKRYATRIEDLRQVPPEKEQPSTQKETPTSQTLADSRVPMAEKGEHPNLPPTDAQIPKGKIKQREEDNTQKEQTEHRSLQNLIKLMAESRGFKATLEAPTVDNGKIDVVLERDKYRIACEVSVTTDTQWELHNIEKCLKGSFPKIVSISKNQKFLTEMQKKVLTSLTPDEQKRVSIYSPEELFIYLEGMDKTSEQPMVMKGYRIKVNYENSQNKSELINKMLNEKNQKNNKG